jgi:hypothetical protein
MARELVSGLLLFLLILGMVGCIFFTCAYHVTRRDVYWRLAFYCLLLDPVIAGIYWLLLRHLWP